MSDRYQGFTQSAIGKLVVKNLGLPSPTKLDRYAEGAPLVDGTVLLGGRGRLAESLPGMLDLVGIASTEIAEEGQTFKGLVFDATGITSTGDLESLRAFFNPVLRSLDRCPHVVVIGTPPEQVHGAERVAQRALEGFTRSLGKEIGRGGAVQLVYVAEGAEASATSTLAFLLSPKSAYVSGQVVRIGAHDTKKAPEVTDWKQPLAGKVALVTGASRGIGEQIARVLHRDGATVVGVDVPQAASELQSLMKELDGDWLTLDITGKDAPQRIAHHLQEKHGGVDVVVHNAGITRDKKLANMDEDRWRLGDRSQSHRPGADHPRAARAGRRQPRGFHRRCRLHRWHRRQRRDRPTTRPPRPASSDWSTRSPTSSRTASRSTASLRASSSRR